MASNSKRVVLFENWIDPEAGDAAMARHPEIELVKLEYSGGEQENWRVLGEAAGYQIQPRSELREPWFADAALVARCPNLLAVTTTGAGYDVIDVDACTKAGVAVCNQGGANSESVVQHVLGMMLVLSKKVALSNRVMMRPGTFKRSDFTGSELTDRTLGIIGIGVIGRRLAALCREAFGMRVLAYDPHLSAEKIAAQGATKASLAEILREADYISLHCPKTPETIDMFGQAEFAAMKPTAYFINAARDGIHSEAALIDALRTGKIAGAGLDVFDQEPPPIDHPLLHFDNVVATPHIGGMTIQGKQNMARYAADQWATILSGKVPPYLINKAVWPLYSERFERIIGIRPQALPA